MSSLKWFKSQKEKELESLKVEEQKLKNKLIEEKLKKKAASENQEETLAVKPYKMVRFVNDILTVVMNDGCIITKSEATVQDFADVRGAVSEEDLLFMLSTKREVEERAEYEKELAKTEKIRDGLPLIDMTGDFVTDGGCFYLKEMYDKGIKRSIPQLLAEKFIDVIGERSDMDELATDTEYNALKKFWLKCCLNPSAQSAEDLYEFLSNHNFKIDRHGNFYAYRRVVSIDSTVSKFLVDFISNTYTKVKAVWKKKPSDYFVYSRLGDYKLVKGDNLPDEDNPYWEKVGNLQELYIDLPDMLENRYTDQHTHKEDYRIGKSASMPRDEGDDDNSISCSEGYHVASHKYDYHGFGDTAVLAIVNPMDVLAVPMNEVGKMRVCRWFFVMTLPEDEEYILDDKDFDVTELGDIFEEECSVDLVNYVHASIAEEVKRHTFDIPKLSNVDITSIVNYLEEVKEILTKRVSVIK